MNFATNPESAVTTNTASKSLIVPMVGNNDIIMVEENVDDEIEMSPIEISNSHVPGGFADSYISPQTQVESLKDQVTTMSMDENTSDVQAIINDYNNVLSFPVHMISAPSPGRSILRKISKYDTITTSTSSIHIERGYKVPIVSDDSVLPSQSDTESQGYPVKVRRMSSSGTPMSSAAAILENLKSALKISRKTNVSVSSSASSSTTSLVECGQNAAKLPRQLRFNANVLVGETYHVEEYDRTPGEMIAKKLTAQVAALVKRELNEFKGREMVVHCESRSNTVFYPL